MTSRAPVRLAMLVAALSMASARLPAQQRPTFASAVNAVRIDARVTNGGAPIAGLTAADFELKDNGVPQQLSVVSNEATPLDVFLAFDTSSSLTSTRLQTFAVAARSLVDRLRPQDRAALVTFNHRVVQRSGLTRDAAQLTAGLAGLTPSGGTSILDATLLTLSLHDAEPDRALLMLFSDGVDTTSWTSQSQVLDLARRSDVIVFPVVPYDARRHNSPFPWMDSFGRGFWHDLTSDTGGRVLEVPADGDMQSVFRDLLLEFQNRYLLAYTPTGVSDSGWHDVSVKLKSHRGTVEARRGYQAKR